MISLKSNCNMAREIEIRFKLNKNQEETLAAWLEKNAIFQGETHHVETYFDRKENSFIFDNINGFKDSEHYLRVRKDTSKGDSMCLKIFKIDQVNQRSENIDEIEFSVSSGEEATRLLKALHFEESIVIDKVRKKYLVIDLPFEICIDQVKDLGMFAEVEITEQIEGDIAVGWRKIKEFLVSIGITEIDEQHRGYVSMLWNPTMNFGKIKQLTPQKS